MSEDFELDWRAGAILIFTIEREKVRDIDYMKKFVDTKKMTKKTLYKHRKHLIKHGLLEKDYDREVDSIIYSVPKQYRHLAQEEELKRSIEEGKPLSIKLQRRTLADALLVSSPDQIALEEFPPKRELLELAAWIRREPSGWAENDNVKNAKLCLEHCPYLVPEIGKPHEDPDSYVFAWTDEAREELNLKETIFSRFFDLKLIYDAMTADLSKEIFSFGPVFVGAYCSPVVVGYVGYYTHMQPLHRVGQPNVYDVIEEPHSVCVAVRKETDTSIRVVHVETRKGKLDKAWVKGLSKQLKAKKNHIIGYDSLREDAKRNLLLNLRSVLEQHKLLISSRYGTLIKDLREYNYRKPSSGYVLALAIAVDLCLK